MGMGGACRLAMGDAMGRWGPDWEDEPSGWVGPDLGGEWTRLDGGWGEGAFRIGKAQRRRETPETLGVGKDGNKMKRNEARWVEKGKKVRRARARWYLRLVLVRSWLDIDCH